MIVRSIDLPRPCLVRRAHGRAVVACLLMSFAIGGACLADDGEAIALVNGHPISRVDFIDVLIEAHGVEALQQMIVLRLSKEEAHRLGLKVTHRDKQREYQEALDRIASEAGMDPATATEPNKRAALDRVLRDRQISHAEFLIGMERNAYLRKIAEREMVFTDQLLREEFARTYGERVVVRHVQIKLGDNVTLNRAQNMLNRGEDFTTVAQTLSANRQTAERGGQMDPFSFDDEELPAALREAAFSLKPGEISSPVLTGQFTHILKLEHRIPPENVEFEDVREQVERKMRERALPKAMNDLAVGLFEKAQIRVLHSALRKNYEKFLNEGAQAEGQ